MKTNFLLKSTLVFLLFFFVACGEDEKDKVSPGGQEVEATPSETEKVPTQPTRGELPDVLKVNDFSLDFLQAAAAGAEEGENLLLSPLSAAFPLAMLSNGAVGEKADALRKLLGYEGVAQEEVNEQFKSLKNLASANEDVIVEQSTVVWADVKFPLLPSFTEQMLTFYEAETKQNDFSDPASLDLINAWVAEQTHDRIPKLLEKLTYHTYLIHTLYFKAPWASPFDPANTKEEAFANADGSLPAVPTMQQGLDTYAYEGDSFDALELDYKGGEYSMVILLPHEGVDLTAVEQQLNPSSFREVLSGMYLYEASVKLPKFTLEYSKELNALLEGIAGRELFGGDYSLISPDFDDVKITVVQKAFAEINEEGTEAAAVTYVGIFGSTGPTTYPKIEFHVNRPFLFLIHEKSTGAILFGGKILNL
jgi:serpin B